MILTLLQRAPVLGMSRRIANYKKRTYFIDCPILRANEFLFVPKKLLFSVQL